MSDFVQDRKLPVMATVSEVLGGSFLHFFNLISIAWFPLILLFGVSLGAVYVTPTMVDPAALNPSDMGEFLGIALVAQIVQAFLYTMIAVVWHRRVLLGENPTGPIYLKFGKREIFFILYLLLIGVFAFVIVGGAFGLTFATASVGGGLIGTVILPVGYILFMFVYLRSILVLPAVAVSQSKPLRTSWAITRGNCWRLFWGFFLIGLVALIVFAIVFIITGLVSGGGELGVQEYLKIFSEKSDMSTIMTFQVTSMVFSVYFMMVGITYLSVCYRHLSGDVNAATDAEAVFGEEKL
ncbi:MAG: hypothetical protein JKY34_00405 [Kordiimonadaceae bacterium]|nr:hypothetical protein [Kordiimonadaceae bacterium]